MIDQLPPSTSLAASLVMHVDGSYITAKAPVASEPSGLVPPSKLHAVKHQTLRALGWAIVACHDDKLIEESGGLQEPANIPAAGYHEHIAFVQAVKFAHRLGVAPELVSLICDDDIFGYAPTWLHQGNLFGARRDQLLERLSFVIDRFFEPATEQLVMQAFERSRIVKIKGHMQHVHQERADYLAKFKAKASVGLEEGDHLGFDAWLAKGFRTYDSATDQYLVQHAPFVLAGRSPEVDLESSPATRLGAPRTRP